MTTRVIRPPWEYLRQATEPSLQSYELSRLNHAANLRKQIAALIDQWLEETADALLARWLLEHSTSQRSTAPRLEESRIRKGDPLG